MSGCEYRRARADEESDILDFINYVFSASSRPHDFKKILPKVYDRPGFSQNHFVAVRDGKIRGTVALLPLEMRVDGERTLRAGYVGSVSVHPYARGEGHMKKLMDLLIADAGEQKMDILALGGHRQRYGYFGFESGGGALTFYITPNNVRHALGEVNGESVRVRLIENKDDHALEAVYALYARQLLLCARPREQFYTIMRSWTNSLYALEGARGELLGYIYAHDGAILEMALADERRLPEVIKAWAAHMVGKAISVQVRMHNRVRANFFKSFAERYAVSDSEMLRVMNWQRVVETLLSFKSACLPLSDGAFIFEVEGAGRWRADVRDHAVSVAETTDAPDMSFTPQRATEFFFSPYTALMTAAPLMKSWLPLPFSISAPDQF